ncbi:hypothetical protein AB0M31_27150 [Streptomyces sp. NPDC051773]|uniref:hypothetical protein n=1 Tax=Streptomyces sp. NPDC051773 TaxID=3156682 RepID=UPI003430E878
MDDTITDLTAIRDNFLGERRLLINAIAQASRGGQPAKEIARLMAGAFGRDQVMQFLAAVAIHDSARKALKEAGLADIVDVSVTGIDAPREARLVLSADPAKIPDHETLPDRIRAALRDFLITLSLPQGEHDEITKDIIDGFLLDGEPVRLVRTEPRT